MGRKNKKLQKEVQIEDSDFSSEDYEIYKPKAEEENELEVDEEAYSILEYVNLEWPSMSLDIFKSKIIFNEFSDQNQSEVKTRIIEIDMQNAIKSGDFNRIEFKKYPINRIFNKIRICDAIFGLSDNFITKLDMKFNVIAEIKGSYRFGLYVSHDYILAGCEDGTTEVYNFDLKLLFKISSGSSPIECVGFDIENEMFVTGSLDKKIRLFDIKGNLVSTIENDSEINSLDIKNGILIFGDDNGKIHIYNIKTQKKEMFEWHCTPISFVRWKDDEIFVSGSDEQVCVWDISIDDQEDTTLPKYLLFVHQGQKYYKDCAFHNNKIIVTSEDGLCLFEPSNFTALEE